jgi:hypothetical protein
MPPTADEQIQFIVNVQRLLDEGAFVASYKYALLLALADLAVESGDESGDALRLTTRQIAEKFIAYYWRQSVPYATAADSRILRQNAGAQAAVLNLISNARREHGDLLPNMMRRPLWKTLVRAVAKSVENMPLWRLQTVGSQRLDFLYDNVGTGATIELRAGVAYCLRKFHGLITDLIKGAWLRYVRRANATVLPETTDLGELLFGSERAILTAVRPALMDLQRGYCFYCTSALRPAEIEVDHFVPWSRYPLDLGHNFVLADDRCNRKKSDRLAAYEHLAAWSERNHKYGGQIGEALSDRGMVSDLPASNRLVLWAYSQAEAVGGLTWLRGEDMVLLDSEWRTVLR